MSKLFIIVTLISIGLFTVAAQERTDRFEAAKTNREQIRAEKAQAAAALPSDFADPDSFGKNAKFLGSGYAGTLYMYRSCDPQVLLDELGLTLAADDKCAVLLPGPGGMQTVEFFDPAWQITIPGRSADNVVYPMLNHGGGYNVFSNTISGSVEFIYSPRVTIESSALNDPAAIDPTTGLPMNGSFTTTLSGSAVRVFSYNAGDLISDSTSRASVAGRGFSRTYWASLGLPQSVIDKLYKQTMTLKFGIRARVRGPVNDAAFFYTVRLLGN